MPEYDGLALLEAIRARDDGGNLPVVFFVDGADAAIEARVMADGMTDFVKKPYEPETLLLRVRRTIELSRLRRRLDAEVEKRIKEFLDRQEHLQLLSEGAKTDPVTGLLDKASAQDAISVLCREEKGVLLLVGIDNFGLVNDIYGRNAGDKVLAGVGGIIRSAVRMNDVVGRIGGDVFITFCENVKEESVINEKSRYINDELVAYAREFLGEDMVIPIGASVGAVVCPDEGRDFLTLYQKADEALCTVKRDGRHGCSFYRESRRPDKGGRGHGGSKVLSLMAEAKPESEQEAVYLPFDDFCVVYRLLVRLNRNYTIRTAFILFSIRPVNEGEQVGEGVLDEFCKSIASSLRSSDVVAKRGEGQCMVLLLHTDIRYGETVAARIIKNWHHTSDVHGYEANYEIELI